MNYHTWASLRRRVSRLQSDTDAPALLRRTGFVVEPSGLGRVTMKAGDLSAAEDVKHDLAALFVWLWSIKDHFVTQLTVKGTNKAIATNAVESYVNAHKELQFAADVANTEKHGTLRRSRSGKYARIGLYTTVTPVIFPDDLNVRQSVKTARAYIPLVGDAEQELGHAAEIALRAVDLWRRFAAEHGLD